MKILNIEPEHDDSRNCLEDLIVSVLNWKKRDYKMMYMNSWYFKYYIDDAENAVSARLKFNSNNNFDILKKYHGVSLSLITKDKILDINEIIKTQINSDKPLIVFVDTYFCDWIDHTYLKIHSEHAFLITGIDNEFFSLVDCSPLVKNKKLPFAFLEKAFHGKILTFTFEEVPPQANISEVFNDLLKNIPSKNDLENICNFSDDLKNINADEEIYKYKNNIFSCEFFSRIQESARGRKKFAELMIFLAKKYNIKSFSNIYQEFTGIANKWLMIRGMLIKSSYNNTYYSILPRVQNILREIKNDEERLLLNILNLSLDTKKLDNSDNFTSNMKKRKITEFKSINLEKIYNNKGFGKESEGGFSGDAVFLKEDFILERVWAINGVGFQFPDVKTSKLDNIVCNGQILSIQSVNKYNKLYILGCSEWGSYVDRITLIYESFSEEKDIFLSDWGIEKPIFTNETIIWNGHALARENGENPYKFKVNLYASYININDKENLKSIILPNCENMHIIAMTLAHEVEYQ